MTAAAPRNKGGRPRTGRVAIPAVRLPADLYFRLQRRMTLIESKGGLPNISKFVRSALHEKLNFEDAKDRRNAAKKPPRSG